jgi:hypothetical protein
MQARTALLDEARTRARELSADAPRIKACADRDHRYRHERETKARAMTVAGRWRIIETELWDRTALDLVAPAFIELHEDGTGGFGLVAVEGSMDCRQVERDDRCTVEFSWHGKDDCDPASGRGWAALQQDGSLYGRIHFHLGDDSDFRAVRAEDESGADATAKSSEGWPRR